MVSSRCAASRLLMGASWSRAPHGARWGLTCGKCPQCSASLGTAKSCRTSNRRRGLNAQHLLVRLFIEADHDCSANPRRGCAQVAGRAHQMRKKRGVVGPILLQVELDDLLALDRHQTVGVGDKFERLRLVVLDFGSFFGRCDRCFDRAKVPLGLLARRSAAAVVHPVDFS